MGRSAAAPAILVVFACSLPGRANPSFDSVAADRLVQEALQAWVVPGAAVVVVAPNSVPWVKGFGRRAMGSDAAVGADTIFPLASCSKAFSTTLAAILADEGKLSLDDPVRRHLPDFHLADPEADAHATLRDVFCHRTGLGSHDYLWYRSRLPLGEIVRRAGFLPFDRPFRTAFHYQSALYTAGGFAVARAGGKPWDELCRERILQPLGMRRTQCVTPSHGPADDVAVPHKPDAAGKLRPIAWYEQSEPNPAGSIHSCARDLVPWLRLHLGDRSTGANRLVSPERLTETHAPHVALPMDAPTRALHPDSNLMSYALGWLLMDYRGYGLVTHAGMIDGFRVQLTLVPRMQIAIAVLVNRHQSRVTNAITNGLLDRLLGLEPRDWNAILRESSRLEDEAAAAVAAERERLRENASRAPRPPAELIGRYDNPAYGTMTISKDGDRLMWEWSTFRSELRFWKSETFTVDTEFLGTQIVEFVPQGAVFFGVPFRKQ